MRDLRPVLFLLVPLAAACGRVPAPGAEAARGEAAAVDSARLVSDLFSLAADSMQGRGTGTEGAARARRFLLAELRASGIRPFGTDFAHPFAVDGGPAGPGRGVNLVGYVRGTEHPERYIVVTAHYDHEGVREGAIYNGADDNASGTAVLLELARHFAKHPPRHSIIFAALDAEERGLQGARAFLREPPVPREAIVLNVNMDMVSRGDRGELYAAGTYHYPLLRPALERVAVAAPVTLRFGHDSPDLGRDDWTQQSDHGVFHAAGIPFVYFGVEDHPDYHRPTDDAERVDPGFFVGAARTILRAVQELDASLR